MTSLEKLQAELRRAVESRQYREAERLVVTYCEAVRTHVSSLLVGSPEVLQTQTTVEAVLQWTGRMLQAGRESIVLDLSRLPRVKRYLQTPPPQAESSWRVEG
ncbi:MAG TPA: hypothetical protein VG096_12065 [Bryobacteraceae bacterium]|jgi:hypothetical protein|nr:hypothetical protein [Bryobacteraceae bacterium]